LELPHRRERQHGHAGGDAAEGIHALCGFPEPVGSSRKDGDARQSSGFSGATAG
jgi:hypothetical protein